MKRIAWIDNAKFIGIFLVVLGHSIPASNHELSTIRNFIYSFHMPLFIFISGYLYKKKRMMNDIISLLVPYFIYQMSNILWILKGSILRLDIDCKMVTKLTLGMLFGNGYGTLQATPPNVPCWFIIALFFIRSFYNYVFEQIYDRYTIQLCISCFIAWIVWELRIFDIDLYFSADSAMMLLIFFTAGIIVKQYEDICLWHKLTQHKMIFVWIFLTFALSLYNGRTSANVVLYGKSSLVYYATALSGILMCISLSKLEYIKTNKFVTTISSGTLLILGYHLLILYPVCHVLVFLGFIGQFIASVLVLALFYLPINWAYKYCPLIMGKRSK